MTVTKEQMLEMNETERRELGKKIFGKILERNPELKLDDKRNTPEKVINPERLTKLDRTKDETES